MENEIIAILNLSKEETMLTTGCLRSFSEKKGVKLFSHVRPQISRSRRSENRRALEAAWGHGNAGRVGGLLKVDFLLLHAQG